MPSMVADIFKVWKCQVVLLMTKNRGHGSAYWNGCGI